MEAGANLVRGIRLSAPLIAGNQRPAGRDTDDTREADPLPYVAHADSVPKLRS